MGSCINYENVASMSVPDGKGTVNYPLARQSSIYSMTFDELQTMGSLGRDIGSLNMEELLKSLWTAEETQVNVSVGGPGHAPSAGGSLQRQGSLTLPRTISQKTVDDVWKELLKEGGPCASKDETDNRVSNTFQRDPTLGEMTLEEFLARAGVVREEIQPVEKPSNSGFCGDFGHTNVNNNGFSIDFQQPNPYKGMLGSQMMGNANEFSFNLASNGNRMGSPRQQQHQQSQTKLQPFSPKRTTVPSSSSQHQQHPQSHRQVQTNSHKQATSPFGSSQSTSSGMRNSVNVSLRSPRAVRHGEMVNMAGSGVTNPVFGIADASLNSPSTVTHGGMMNIASSGMSTSVGMTNSSLTSPRAVAHSGLMNMAGLRGVTTTVTGGSPLNNLHADTSSKSSLDSPPLSSSPYADIEGGQGRRSSGSLEKQMERRKKRMIKNRESAARSRARKQAYIVQLEGEITKLKESNRQLKEKQVELMAMQKNQVPESGQESKRRRLCRTSSGPL